MHFSLNIILGVGLVLTDALVIEPYYECGSGLSQVSWQCAPGHSCRQVSYVVTLGSGRSQCLPDSGTVLDVNFPWTMCGGRAQPSYGSHLCSPGWVCTVANEFYSFCYPPDPLPAQNSTLAAAGDQCGNYAAIQGKPSVCIPGYLCTALSYGQQVCLPDGSPVTTTTAAPATSTTSAIVTTIKTTTLVRTSTTKTTKTTTTKTTKTTKTTTTKKVQTTKAGPPHP